MLLSFFPIDSAKVGTFLELNKFLTEINTIDNWLSNLQNKPI